MLDNRTVGKTIAQLRMAVSYTQQDLAERMNVSHQAVSKWETGLALPDMQTMLELSKLFGVSIEQILTGDIPSREPEPEEAETPETAETVETAETPDEVGQEPDQKHEGGMNFKRLVGLAPFLGREKVEELVDRSFAKQDWNAIAGLAPFVSREKLSELVSRCEAGANWNVIMSLAPFMDKEKLGKLVDRGMKGEEEPARKDKPRPRDDSARRSIKDRIAAKAIREANWQWIEENIESIEDPQILAEIVERADEWMSECGFMDELLEKLGQESALKLAQCLFNAERWGEMDEVFAHLSVDQRAEFLKKAVREGRLEFVEEFADQFPKSILEEVFAEAVEESDWEMIKALEDILD